MKCFFVALALTIANPIFAASSFSSSTPSSSSKPQPAAPKPAEHEFKKELIKIPKKVPVRQEFYPNPGIVSNLHGKWVGSDHLLNVPDHIGITIEVLQPENSKVALPTDALHHKIEEAFKKEHIVGIAEARKDGPPMPFLHILIMLFPIDKGYSAYIGARLFEEVKKHNVEVSGRTALQAITWERQTLIIFPTEALNDQIDKAVMDIVKDFLERYEFFVRYKPKNNRD